MKSEILQISDKLLITQEFIEDNRKYNPNTWHVWKLNSIVKVLELSDFSTVKIGTRLFTTWVTNSIAENMRKSYEQKNNPNKS